DRSASRRLLKMKRNEEKKRIKDLQRTKKRASKNKISGSPWDDTPSSSNIRTVNKCNHCGAMNDSDSQYCISCGNYLLS
ncbi:MAG TPA: zinc ribbon domain-containing protein, partial [Candidatus Poseidoniales archaeon]